MKPLAIELGLSVRWADRNLGAEDIFLPGTLFQPSGRSRSMDEEVGIINEIIKSTMGGRWRLPTVSEVRELQESCTIWRCTYRRLKDPMDEKKGHIDYGIYKVKGKNGRHCYFNEGYHLLSGINGYGIPRRPAMWELVTKNHFYPYYHERRELYHYPNWQRSGDDIFPYGAYYSPGLPIRPVTDELSQRRDKFLRFFEYTPLPGDSDSNIDVHEKLTVRNHKYLTDDQFEVSDEEKTRRYNAEYKRKQQMIEQERAIREEKRKNDLMAGRVYHKVQLDASYRKGDPFDSSKGFAMDTVLVRHDELMAIISGGMSARKAWLASHSTLFYEDIIDVDITYNLRKAYDKDGNLLSDDY